MKKVAWVGAAVVLGAVLVGACVTDAPGLSCDATQKGCAGVCVAKDDPTKGCATNDCSPCSAPPNAAATCVAGACASACLAGFDDCDSNPANGCETKLATDAANCGTCSNVCGSANTSSASFCQAGKCVFACNAGFAHCGPDAAGCDTNLQTSATNCGACGHSCGGGTCTAGKCDPVLLTTADTPSGIALDATNVYYTLPSSDTVMRIGKDGTCVPASPCPQLVAQGTGPDVRGPEAILSDGTNVYWTAAAASRIGWVPTAGGTVNGFGSTGATEPGVLAIGGGKLWWTNGSATATRLQSASLDGTSITTMATASFAGRGNVTTDASYVYWSNDQGSVYRAAFTDSVCNEQTTCTSVGSANSPVGIAVDGTYVYWTSPSSGAVGRNPKGGGLTAFVASNQDMPQAIVVDSTYIYWGNIGTTSVGASIRRAPLSGGTCNGSACELFHAVTVPNALAIDDTAVYWVDKSNSGGVYKLVK